jgi:hypothetical protein
LIVVPLVGCISFLRADLALDYTCGVILSPRALGRLVGMQAQVPSNLARRIHRTGSLAM